MVPNWNHPRHPVPLGEYSAVAHTSRVCLCSQTLACTHTLARSHTLACTHTLAGSHTLRASKLWVAKLKWCCRQQRKSTGSCCRPRLWVTMSVACCMAACLQRTRLQHCRLFPLGKHLFCCPPLSLRYAWLTRHKHWPSVSVSALLGNSTCYTHYWMLECHLESVCSTPSSCCSAAAECNASCKTCRALIKGYKYECCGEGWRQYRKLPTEGATRKYEIKKSKHKTAEGCTLHMLQIKCTGDRHQMQSCSSLVMLVPATSSETYPRSGCSDVGLLM